MQKPMQLSLDVAEHPALRNHEGALLAGSVKVGVNLPVTSDLERGDQLTVVVSDADGTVIAAGEATVTGVGFVNVEVSGIVVGTERVHKAKLD